MAIELKQVLLAVLLAFAHFVIFAVRANRELGVGYTTGPRDEPPRGLSQTTERLRRGFANYVETLPWFAFAAIVTHLAGKADDVSRLAGWVYLIARVGYLPAYVVHVPLVRSTLWAIATGAIFVIALRPLL